jgi:hypothetical protein
MAIVSQSTFAKIMDVSRKTVTTWKAKNLLVMQGDQVDEIASKKLLQKYRPTPAKSVTSERGKNAKKPAAGNKSGNKNSAALGNNSDAPKRTRNKPPPEPGSPEADALLALEQDGAPHTINEARRIKENYLAKLRELEFQEKTGELVELALVERVLFKSFRQQRDAWLNWPAKVGPLIAAELDIDSDKVVAQLNEYVHKQISQLSEPVLDFEAEQD